MPRLKKFTTPEMYLIKGLPVHPTRMITRILMFLAHQDGKWATWGSSMYMPSVQQAFPTNIKEITQLKFMQKLQKAGLVGGCDCGCRGDYVLTDAGLNMLATDSFQGYKEKERWDKEGFARNGY